MIRIFNSKDIGRLLARRTARMIEAEDTVRPVLEAVRKRGDKGLLEFARKFDRLERKSVRVPPQELAEAANRLTPEFRSAVEVAAANVRSFAEEATAARIFPRCYRFEAAAQDRRFGQAVVRPLDTVGAYIPAGRYALPSTLIMTAVPAQATGVRNLLCRLPESGR